LSSGAMPVCVPCRLQRSEIRAITPLGSVLCLLSSAHFFPRAPSGSRTHTSAMARRQAAATSWARQRTRASGGIRTHNIALEARDVAVTPRTQSVEAVGIEPTFSCLRGRGLASVGPHFRSSGSGEESNPAGTRPSVLETEHAPRREPYPYLKPAPVAHAPGSPSGSYPKNEAGRGSLLPPAGADRHEWQPGVTRSYRFRRHRPRSAWSARSPRRPRGSSVEGHSSRATGSW
jgi:hypothetical protein